MIKLEFVGNKPIVDSHGVSFDTKHDKYEYIEPAIHILDMVYNLVDSKVTDKITLDVSITPEAVFTILKKVSPKIESIYEDKISKYKQHIKEQEQKVIQSKNLKPEEKKAYYNNLEIMEKYRTQRATNKIIYEEIINNIIDIILEKKITKIVVYYNNQFLHSIESIESTLERSKPLTRTKLKIIATGEKPHIELDIQH
jgi:hypothetical protein